MGAVKESVQVPRMRRTNGVALKRRSTRCSAISAPAVKRRSIAFDRAVAHATIATAITIVKRGRQRADLHG